MFTLLFFNVQPPINHHAFRRSRFAGISCLLMNKTLGLFLLAVGVSIKLSVETVATGQREHTTFAVRLLGWSVACSLLMLLGMRCCHYAGKFPRWRDPPNVRRLFWLWWVAFGLGCVLPFGFIEPVLNYASSLDRHHSPVVVAIASYSVWLLILCVVDSWFTHVLELYLPKEGEEEETEPLRSAGGHIDKDYGAKTFPEFMR